MLSDISTTITPARSGRRESSESERRSRSDAVVIGAGPYGIAVAAALHASGIDVTVFGDVMGFWAEMPEGMLLRSPWSASSIGPVRGDFSLDAYQDQLGSTIARPLPLAAFIDYGRWVAQNALPAIDSRRVVAVEPIDGEFDVALEEGEIVSCARVVLALGIGCYAARPRQFDGLPSELVSHSADLSRPADFAGRRVALVGAGQSAVELSALLAEAGAEVELLIRADDIRWLDRSARLHRLGPLMKLLYSPTDVGPAGLSRLIAVPNLYRKTPRGFQEKAGYRAVRPAASSWLRKRIEGVAVSASVEVRTARPVDGGLELLLSDGSSRKVDHTVCATGFRVDLARHPLVSRELGRRIKMRDGYPLLSGGFETSFPNLYVVGAPASYSFGPLMRFVAGSGFTTRRLVASVVRGPRVRT
jgi:FAD-dependent urate hydroxylase